VSDDLKKVIRAAFYKERSFWGLRMADSTYKDQFIETETKMGEGTFRLLGAHGKSPLKH
jgi:hypothetical protein